MTNRPSRPRDVDCVRTPDQAYNEPIPDHLNRPPADDVPLPPELRITHRVQGFVDDAGVLRITAASLWSLLWLTRPAGVEVRRPRRGRAGVLARTVDAGRGRGQQVLFSLDEAAEHMAKSCREAGSAAAWGPHPAARAILQWLRELTGMVDDIQLAAAAAAELSVSERYAALTPAPAAPAAPPAAPPRLAPRPPIDDQGEQGGELDDRRRVNDDIERAFAQILLADLGLRQIAGTPSAATSRTDLIMALRGAMNYAFLHPLGRWAEAKRLRDENKLPYVAYMEGEGLLPTFRQALVEPLPLFLRVCVIGGRRGDRLADADLAGLTRRQRRWVRHLDATAARPSQSGDRKCKSLYATYDEVAEKMAFYRGAQPDAADATAGRRRRRDAARDDGPLVTP